MALTHKVWSTEILVRVYHNLDTDTSTMNMAGEVARMGTMQDIAAELRRRGLDVEGRSLT